MMLAHQTSQAAHWTLLAAVFEIAGRDPMPGIREARQSIRRANEQAQRIVNSRQRPTTN
jgi:hypothetical protein